jgi:predicted metal-dependent hydrolase
METVEQARAIILKELTSDDPEVRGEFLKLFDAEAKVFADAMAHAFIGWRTFDNEVKGDERRAHVSALIHAAITLHILSLKLFLSGHIVAAGNLFRQVIESIALALLYSGKSLDVLACFMEDKYSGNVAVRDVQRHAEKLSLKGDALEVLRNSQKFYDKYSHITKMTIAIGMSFEQQGGLYVGASFDRGKIDAYVKEVEGRTSLAKVFPNFVAGVTANVAKW